MLNIPAFVLREVLEHLYYLRDFDLLTAETDKDVKDLVRDRVDEIQEAIAPHVPGTLLKFLPPNLRDRK